MMTGKIIRRRSQVGFYDCYILEEVMIDAHGVNSFNPVRFPDILPFDNILQHPSSNPNADAQIPIMVS